MGLAAYALINSKEGYGTVAVAHGADTVVPHGLGAEPNVALISAVDANGVQTEITAKDAANITLHNQGLGDGTVALYTRISPADGGGGANPFAGLPAGYTGKLGANAFVSFQALAAGDNVIDLTGGVAGAGLPSVPHIQHVDTVGTAAQKPTIKSFTKQANGSVSAVTVTNPLGAAVNAVLFLMVLPSSIK